MGLRDIGATLPPGFRFYPSDEELVCHYLYKKIAKEEALIGSLVEIDLHTCEPWQLPEVAKLNTTEWYFFSFRDRKYATGFRTNRATTSGYWKATGKDRIIFDPMTREIVGMRKTLVFYKNRAPNGIKTGWIMHEFRLESPHMPPKENWVLCRVFHKSKTEENNNNNNNNPCHHIHDHTNSSSPSCYTCQHPNSFSSNNPISSLQQPIIINNDDENNNNNDNDNDNVVANQISNLTASQSLNPSNSFLNLLKEGNPSFSWGDFVTPKNMKNDDEYGFLWEMDLEENNNNNNNNVTQISKLGDEGGLHVPSNCLPQLDFGDDHMGFDQDYGGTVFF